MQHWLQNVLREWNLWAKASLYPPNMLLSCGDYDLLQRDHNYIHLHAWTWGRMHV